MADSVGLDLFQPQYGGLPYNKWITVHIIALSVISMSVSGSSYIIIITFQKRLKSSLTLMQTFPMYIALTDILFGFFHGADHLTSVINGRVSNGPLCEFFGFTLIYSIIIPSFWVSSCALYIHMAVVHRKQLNLGPRDCILHAINWGVPFIICLIALANKEFGPEACWCGLPTSLWVYQAWVVVVSLFMNVGLYMATYRSLMTHYYKERKIKKTQIAQGSSEKGGSKSSHIQSQIQSASQIQTPSRSNTIKETQDCNEEIRKAARKLPIFVLIFIVQWTPYALYAFLLAAGLEFYPIVVLVVLIANAGGIWNAIAYKKFLMKTSKNAKKTPQTQPQQQSIMSSAVSSNREEV